MQLEMENMINWIICHFCRNFKTVIGIFLKQSFLVFQYQGRKGVTSYTSNYVYKNYRKNVWTVLKILKDFVVFLNAQNVIFWSRDVGCRCHCPLFNWNKATYNFFFFCKNNVMFVIQRSTAVDCRCRWIFLHLVNQVEICLKLRNCLKVCLPHFLWVFWVWCWQTILWPI